MKVHKNVHKKNLQTHSVNVARRKLLQGAAVGTGAVLAPGFASAVASSNSFATGGPESGDRYFDRSVSDASIVVEFSDHDASFVDGALARVSIYNNGEQEVVLSHLSMSDVITEQGVYDINSRLRRSPIAVGPEGVYHFWLAPGAAKTTLVDSTGQSTPVPVKSASAVELVPVKLQLRIIRGESEYTVAQNNRMIDALVEYKVS